MLLRDAGLRYTPLPGQQAGGYCRPQPKPLPAGSGDRQGFLWKAVPGLQSWHAHRYQAPGEVPQPHSHPMKKWWQEGGNLQSTGQGKWSKLGLWSCLEAADGHGNTGSAGRDTAEGEILIQRPQDTNPTANRTQPGWEQLNPFTRPYIPTASPGLANTGTTAAPDWWRAQAPARDWPGLTVRLRAALRGDTRPAVGAESVPVPAPPRRVPPGSEPPQPRGAASPAPLHKRFIARSRRCRAAPGASLPAGAAAGLGSEAGGRGERGRDGGHGFIWAGARAARGRARLGARSALPDQSSRRKKAAASPSVRESRVGLLQGGLRLLSGGFSVVCGVMPTPLSAWPRA